VVSGPGRGAREGRGRGGRRRARSNRSARGGARQSLSAPAQGRLSARSVSRSKPVLCVEFLWACSRLKALFDAFGTGQGASRRLRGACGSASSGRTRSAGRASLLQSGLTRVTQNRSTGRGGGEGAAAGAGGAEAARTAGGAPGEERPAAAGGRARTGVGVAGLLSGTPWSG
jgi:hypothetical protein